MNRKGFALSCITLFLICLIIDVNNVFPTEEPSVTVTITSTPEDLERVARLLRSDPDVNIQFEGDSSDIQAAYRVIVILRNGKKR